MCFSSVVRRVSALIAVALVSSAAPLRAQEASEPPQEPSEETHAQEEAESAPAAVDGPAGEAPVVTDPSAAPTHRDIRERVDALEARAGARDQAGEAIDHARIALRRARELEARGNTRGANRARQIAWAAVSLASRQMALARERQLLRAIARRLERAEERARQARTALSHAIAQRDRMRQPAREEEMRPSEESDLPEGQTE